MNFNFDCEREIDARWWTEVGALPGALAYGGSANEAMAKAQVLAWQLLAERIEHREDHPIEIKNSRPWPHEPVAA